MRTWSRSTWLWSISVIVLVGGLFIASLVAAHGNDRYKHKHKQKHDNPFTQILEMLDEILDELKNGSVEGNHTLRWDQAQPAAQRFVVLAAFNNAAVLDKNTGLVWEQAPSLSNLAWDGAASSCVNKTVGGTAGWRLPSVVELRSVQDPSLPAPLVPTSVFTGIQDNYWSASTSAAVAGSAWGVFFTDGFAVPNLKTNSSSHAWCVRGPMSESVY